MSDAGIMYANAKALHELLQEARAENDKLVMKLNAEHIVRQNVERENAKLRELVRDMHRAICGLVVLGDDYAGEYEDRLCALDDRMCELGVDA